MHEKIVTSVYLEKGQKLFIGADTEHKDIPYYKVGRGTTNKQGTSMNLIQLMTELSKPEQVIISLLEKNLNPWDEYSLNCVKLDMASLSSTEKQYLKKAYPLLANKGIIRRVKRGLYMFNPSFILHSKAQDKALELWESLDEV